ncbi:histone-lysine N-methyltransferase, H3 lysine-9 specific SUVH1-like [Tasmannia lanceolata]|uniref:histone-lysine N-methyltransferase, H3 lysine-9 specific SUVH1-like n=1 Tax=Tasmannia lanceolata TaxID=3420 RepID=UPI0040637B5A
MEGGSSSNPSISDSHVLDVKPLRCLAPMFPSPYGFTTSYPNASPYVCVSPMTSTPAPGFPPVFPNSIPSDCRRPPHQTNPQPTSSPVNVGEAASYVKPIQTRPPSFHTPPPYVGSANGNVGPSGYSTYRTDHVTMEPVILNREGMEKGGSAEPELEKSKSGRNRKRPLRMSSYTACSSDMDGSEGKSQKVKEYKRVTNNDETALSLPLNHHGDRESVERTLMMFDAIRRRLLQLEDLVGATSGSTKRPRPDLKAGTTLMNAGHRTNMQKRVGAVPGVEIGDLFYFRFELCLVGLHAPSMGGIDYMNVKFDEEEDPIAVSIVSSGVYDDDVDNTDILIYSGQGGTSKQGKQIHDQKLERGNLALDRSLRRVNEIRVIRGIKDATNPNNKMYVYDGLYKIHESWIEKDKSGFSVFKYKLLRVPGQPDGIAIWRLSQQWKQNPSTRGSVILPDISSGIENLPVCLVNDIDDEKGPAHFSYVTTVKYVKAISFMKPSLGCKCHGACVPGDTNCCCTMKNGGDPPYLITGLLVSRKPLIYECNSSCLCSLNCRNRVSQLGVKVRLEVFRTRDRGWGLRSWDPIRAGSFICEYTGEVIDEIKGEDEDEDDEYIFKDMHTSDNSFEWDYPHELLGEESGANLRETSKQFPIIISAKNMGNVSRFMNHSCSPNVFWQPVLYDHDDECYPHIMFYALKHIPPMTELTYDYGPRGDQSGEEEVHSVNRNRRRQKCLCGSSKCRGYFG